MMNKLIRLLLVEDSEDDAFLLIHNLKKSELNFYHKRVETADEFRKEIDTENWDIIISDYSLPHFSGGEALAITMSKGYDIPFIIVSGTIGEELAVAMMKAGATDYIMKGNLARLSSAIQREIKDAEIRKLHRKAKEERDSIFNLSLDLICISDFNGFFQHLNPAWEKVLGFTIEELKSKPLIEFVHPDDSQKTIDVLKNLSQSLNVFVFENRFLCKNGDYKWFMWNGTTSPEQKLFYAIARDLTEYKKSQEALHESEKKYRFLADNTLDVIWQTDLELNTKYVNPAIFSLLGYTPEEFLHTDISKYSSSSELKRFHSLVKNILVKSDTQKSVIIETELYHKDGRIIPVEINAALITDSDGNPLGMQGTTRDIIERKKAKEELITAKEKAEEANRLKSGFLAAMSHEIRTPLNAILGFNYVLKEIYLEKSPANVQKYFSYIEEAGKRLLGTISAILDISRIEANEFTTTLSKIDINKAISETYNICKILADEKKLNLNLELSEKNVFVLADEYCLNGVLTNVINNSIKYSEKGTIKISVKRIEHFAVCKISDEGIGMSEEYQTQLFETFSQENMGWNRKYEGSGLGLALTKRYINLMNGHIDVKSKKDVGTTVTIKIPIFST